MIDAWLIMPECARLFNDFQSTTALMQNAVVQCINISIDNSTNDKVKILDLKELDKKLESLAMNIITKDNPHLKGQIEVKVERWSHNICGQMCIDLKPKVKGLINNNKGITRLQ